MIAVIDYGIGNLRSAEKALNHVGGDAVLVTDPAEVRGADGVVLPGVGAFGACAEALRAGGFEDTIHEAVEAGVPFLGLCIGFQLLFDASEESPGTRGLGIVPGVVRHLDASVKLPQMQWNLVEESGARRPAMLEALEESPWFYFVHSYAPRVDEVAASDVALVSTYGTPYVAAIERGSLWGTQFHPEKSGRAGLSLLANFVRLCDKKRLG